MTNIKHIKMINGTFSMPYHLTPHGIAKTKRLEKPIACKCGTFPKIGDIFYFRSKITGTLVIGEVKEISRTNITSTTGVLYPNHEIEIKPLDVRRSEALNSIFDI